MNNFDRRTFIKPAAGGVAGLRRAVTQGGAGRIATTRSSENVFLLSGAGANVIAMTGEDGAVMVDGGLAEHSGALLAAVAALSGGGPARAVFKPIGIRSIPAPI